MKRCTVLMESFTFDLCMTLELVMRELCSFISFRAKTNLFLTFPMTLRLGFLGRGWGASIFFTIFQQEVLGTAKLEEMVFHDCPLWHAKIIFSFKSFEYIICVDRKACFKDSNTVYFIKIGLTNKKICNCSLLNDQIVRNESAVCRCADFKKLNVKINNRDEAGKNGYILCAEFQ